MKAQRAIVVLGPLTALLLGGLAVFALFSHPAEVAKHPLVAIAEHAPALPTVADSGQPLTLRPPPSTCSYCTHNLVGKSAREIGQYAVERLQEEHAVYSGEPQVLAARAITREEFTALGLGCLGDSIAIE